LAPITKFPTPINHSTNTNYTAENHKGPQSFTESLSSKS